MGYSRESNKDSFFITNKEEHNTGGRVCLQMGDQLKMKLCAGCKCMIPYSNKGWYCPKCKKKDRKEYNPYAEVYGSNRWKKTRDKMRRENVFCEVCQEIGIKGVLATEVHHLVKVSLGDKDSYYDESKLVSVCHRHHVMIENMTRDELIKALQDGSLI